MKCPKCGARFDKALGICRYCGTKLSQIAEATHSGVKEAIENYEPEQIVMSTVFPSDLSRKNALFLCIFLGLLGAHNFYTRRRVRAIIGLVLWSVGIVLFWVYLALTANGDASFYPFIDRYMMGGAMPGVLMVCGILMWSFDLIRILTNNYKIPVVLKE